MSVVGPRPVVDEELNYYESDATYYLSTRPGLTGLWQISGRNDVSYQTRVKFDTQYVQNWSMKQDVFIIFKTIKIRPQTSCLMTIEITRPMGTDESQNINGILSMKSATRSAVSPLSNSEEFDVSFPIGGIAKRSFDVTSAVLALLIFSPIFLMIMALVKFTDRGPMFYGHRRVGHNGRTFHCLKFRTMVMNGDEVLRQYIAANPEAAEEWKATRKLKNDPRVTAVGNVLRKLSLDELP